MKFGCSSSFLTRWRILANATKKEFVRCMATPKIEDTHTKAERRLLARADRVLVRMAGEIYYCSNFGLAQNILAHTHREFCIAPFGWRMYAGVDPTRCKVRWGVAQLHKVLTPQMQNPTTAATVTGLLTTTTEKE